MSRLQKHKRQKKKKLVLMSKVVVAFYLLIFSFSYLTGGTIAYFSNANQATLNFGAGTWFDGSKLKFVGNRGTNVDQSCPIVEISADFKNVGHKMQGPAEYEIYYTGEESKGKGAPEKHGTSIFKGEFNALDKDEVITLSFEAKQEGFYVFKVYQREGFEAKGNEKAEIFSDKFIIQCKDGSENNEKNTEGTEQDTNTSNEDIGENSQEKEPVNEEKEEVGESTEEPVKSDTPQQDPPGDDSNQSNEQNDNAANDVPENQDNTTEESLEEETTNTNNQPVEEGETNE
ncbi:amyloid fiber anchoring/assembly protein TapA [Paucisalibacillus globulus]|uniref:amyloid fiber anchoring/assembly protein TapA n=1 Tax=Paucisalibacillus globulus TaxID=351095 RepID=UPI001FDF24D5|nr:amyloid fiber anchoring/assembly protein TapA [Paucisalibacillus globulus]